MQLFNLMHPEDLQAHQYQFSWSGLMDPYLNSLEPLGISCIVVYV